MDIIALAVAKKYTEDSLKGAGAVKGQDGKSAYQIWLDEGNIGSEQDFLNNLKGEKGDKGDRGEDGKISQVQKKTITAAEINVLDPNTMYVFGEVGSLNVEFNIKDSNYRDEYIFSFTSGAEPTVLTMPSEVKWVNELTIEANKSYEISVVDNVGLWCAVDLAVTE